MNDPFGSVFFLLLQILIDCKHWMAQCEQMAYFQCLQYFIQCVCVCVLTHDHCWYSTELLLFHRIFSIFISYLIEHRVPWSYIEYTHNNHIKFDRITVKRFFEVRTVNMDYSCKNCNQFIIEEDGEKKHDGQKGDREKPKMSRRKTKHTSINKKKSLISK